jgi:hypothetical protein
MADQKSTDEFLNLPIAFVLTDHMQRPDMGAIARALRSRHPALDVEMSGADQSGAPLIRCGGEFITIMSMPGPVLPSMSDPAWARASATGRRRRPVPRQLAVADTSSSRRPGRRRAGCRPRVSSRPLPAP